MSSNFARHDVDRFNLSTTLITTLIKSRAAGFFDFDGAAGVPNACSKVLLQTWDVHQSQQIPNSLAWLKHIDVTSDPLWVVHDAKSEGFTPTSVIMTVKILHSMAAAVSVPPVAGLGEYGTTYRSTKKSCIDAAR